MVATAKVEYEDLKFEEGKDSIRAVFLKYYHFYISKGDLEKIGRYKVKDGSIEFDASEKTVTNKFNRLLKIGLSGLKSLFGTDTVYIHAGSGIPLIGTNEFGVVDRDTNIVEVKPHSLCNLNCVYCSVDAGRGSRKKTDFVVEERYLAEEAKKVILQKKNPVEVSINPQGEPLMYSRIVELVGDLKRIRNVKTVSINTSGSLLSKALIDELQKAGLDRLNISLNTVSKKTADKLSGAAYPLEKVKDAIRHCDGKIEVLIAPLIVPGYNDEEIGELLSFCKTLKSVPRYGFQNFLNYQKGRNPVKSKGMPWFEKLLRKYEKEQDVRLINTKEDYSIVEDARLKKPFRKGGIVLAKVACNGKYANERLCVSEERIITVASGARTCETLRVRIVRDKHNIFKGTVI